ncbi:MAG TPA: prepilin-type N-terminal cleavage/methylation domain-containing protein [Candidatus Limnocylindria bacterium]|jgi:prepilin-type N-terminal cleavage/methylation domain-containing protein/prepilin-type processing-associated H-X9-DG protein|nr:prepilin-type N-terminal cleavage/methylation domain-containing protein [Candidatus Limnocylindria bacterium]
MTLRPTTTLRRAFTLVELLVVIAIIGILAAMILPAVTKTLVKTRQTWCGHNLTQIGIGIHSFAHDHASRFPQQVSTQNGGVLEPSLMASPLVGELWLRPEVFRALSNELGNFRVAYCPATKLVATNFASLIPADVTYFLNLGSRYDQPESMVSGDNNLDPRLQTRTNNGTLLELQWTPPRHESRGNILFADGHVEGHRNLPYFFRPSDGRPTGNYPTTQPTGRTGGGSGGSAATGSPSTPAGGGGPAPNRPFGSASSLRSAPGYNPAVPVVAPVPFVFQAHLPPQQGPAPDYSDLVRKTALRRLPHEDVVERSFWWIYLLMLLLGLLALLVHWRRRQRDRERQGTTAPG